MTRRYPKPDWEPSNWLTFKQWVEQQTDAPEDEQGAWAYIAAHTPYIDAALYGRYQVERLRRSEHGRSPDHAAPGYHSCERYKRCYVRSPAEFWEMVCQMRTQRKRPTGELTAHQQQREQEKQEKAEERTKRQRACEEAHQQGLSRNQMCKRLGGDRNRVLRLIRDVLDL